MDCKINLPVAIHPNDEQAKKMMMNDSGKSEASYILHSVLNPFVEDKINFRRSVFFISLLTPILFFFCLKQKFKNQENLLLILISSTLLLSPYFRTSAYWALGENYGLIILLLTFLSINFLDEQSDLFIFKTYITFFLGLYFNAKCWVYF